MNQAIPEQRKNLAEKLKKDFSFATAKLAKRYTQLAQKYKDQDKKYDIKFFKIRDLALEKEMRGPLAPNEEKQINEHNSLAQQNITALINDFKKEFPNPYERYKNQAGITIVTPSDLIFALDESIKEARGSQYEENIKNWQLAILDLVKKQLYKSEELETSESRKLNL